MWEGSQAKKAGPSLFFLQLLLSTYYTPVLFTEVGDIAPNKVKKKLLSPWARARPSGNFKKGCSHVS